MRAPLLLLLILWFASVTAQRSCSPFFEFTVDNCTACPALDHTRGDIEVAVCEERAANTSYACVCRQPYDHSVTASFFYFPQVDGSGTRCANSWGTAPHTYAALSVVASIFVLYPTTHFFYIAVISGMFSCKRHKCTKMDISALLAGVYTLLAFVHLVVRITSQGKDVGTSGAEYYARAHHSMTIVTWSESAFFDLSLALYCTSVSDTLYPGEEMNSRRRCINLLFWILVSTATLCTMFMIAVLCVSEDLSEIINAYVAPLALCVRTLTFVFSAVFMAIAHRAMHQVSLLPTPLASSVRVSVIIPVTSSASNLQP